MKPNLLVSAAAVVCMAWPAASSAQSSDQGQGHVKEQGQAQAKGKGEAQGQGQGQAKGKGQAKGQSQGQGHGYGQVQGQGQGQVQGQPKGQGHGYGQVQGQGQVQRQTGQQGYHGKPGGGAVQTQPVYKPAATHRPPATVTTRPPASTPALSGWRRGVTGPAQVQAGQQWRQQHSGWDSRTVWRQNPNWWRGHSAFRQWSGVRLGFFFIPELGYVSAPSEYWSRHWRAGDYLPNWFWRYPVRDFWNYGLPQPPDGCAWVWVNNDVALIDLDDGYILDMELNVW